MKHIVTVTGIRPDFIRMSEVFNCLDTEPGIKHTMIHTGQHYDKLLSDVFFEDLDLRQPDYNLKCGGGDHAQQLSLLAVHLPPLLRELKPDWVVFLGDTNSVLIAPVVAKEHWKVAHIEAGMRSGDRRMLEEINRIVCDHSSDLLFAYHEDNKKNLVNEGIPENRIKVVGNTITSVIRGKMTELGLYDRVPMKDFILLDIHRPENFQSLERMVNIFKFSIQVAWGYDGIPVKMIGFPRTVKAIEDFKIPGEWTEVVETIPMMGYNAFIEAQWNAAVIISDSGTAQDEACWIGTKVLVPRDYTERPQSVLNDCSYMVNMNITQSTTWYNAIWWAKSNIKPRCEWTSIPNTITATAIVRTLTEEL